MKYIISTAITLLLSFNILVAQNKCLRKANFGTAKICIPKIDGYTECYNEPLIKELADKTEAAENIVLGYYINNSIYNKKDSLAQVGFNDFFKVYATKQVKDLKANTVVLKQVKEMLTENFIKMKWEEISEEIDETLNAKIGAPILIENYSLNKKSFTNIMLVKYKIEGMEPYTMAMTINGYLKADRLIWMAYYLNYENKETIKSLKKNSNRILTKLLN